MRAVMFIGIALGLLCLVIRAGWHVLVCIAGAGEWRRQHHPAYVLLDPERPVPVGLILLAVLFGAAVGAVSLAIFIALDIDAPEHIGRLGELFPGIEQIPFAQQFTTILTMLTGAAIAEEIMFCGLMLRISGGTTAGVIG